MQIYTHNKLKLVITYVFIQRRYMGDTYITNYETSPIQLGGFTINRVVKLNTAEQLTDEKKITKTNTAEFKLPAG